MNCFKKIVALVAVMPCMIFAADFGQLPDPYTGLWAGSQVSGSGARPVYAHVIRYKQSYEVSLRADDNSRSDVIARFVVKPEKGQLRLVDSKSVSDVAQDGNLITGSLNDSGTTFSISRTSFEPSETLGRIAPEGAVVLYDGHGLDAWAPISKNSEIGWTVVEDGSLEVHGKDRGKQHKQDIRSKQEFGDYELHLEFKLAYMPQVDGQARSNSGIFHFGRYETQILDSFGLVGEHNEAGGIYKKRVPDFNAVYPPGLWQTYDVVATAPRFDTAGKKVENARLTVRLNGVLIHDDVEVPKTTNPKFEGGSESATGPIILQDHGNPVQYRNVWVKPL